MRNFLLFFLLVSPTIICTFSRDRTFFAAAEDEIEDEIVDVEGENDNENEDSAIVGDDIESEDEAEVTKSPFADTFLLFTKPLRTPGVPLDLPAGQSVDFLVGFANRGPDDFVVESVEASFRYPMDFTYYIQNFSAIPYNREVKPGHEATVMYSFLPSDSFAGRPFGLNIALNYRDVNDIKYSEAVFNETVQIIEIEEGLDAETFFLYVFLAGIVILLLALGQQFLVGSVGKRKRSQAPRKTIETGTTNNTDVDYDWLPAETLRSLQKSPKVKSSIKTPPKVKQSQSPKQRKVKRTAGSDD